MALNERMQNDGRPYFDVRVHTYSLQCTLRSIAVYEPQVIVNKT